MGKLKNRLLLFLRRASPTKLLARPKSDKASAQTAKAPATNQNKDGNKRRIGFFDLPREIRDMIYDLTTNEIHKVCFERGCTVRGMAMEGIPTLKALLINRQFLQEYNEWHNHFAALPSTMPPSIRASTPKTTPRCKWSWQLDFCGKTTKDCAAMAKAFGPITHHCPMSLRVLWGGTSGLSDGSELYVSSCKRLVELMGSEMVTEICIEWHGGMVFALWREGSQWIFQQKLCA